MTLHDLGAIAFQSHLPTREVLVALTQLTLHFLGIRKAENSRMFELNWAEPILVAASASVTVAAGADPVCLAKVMGEYRSGDHDDGSHAPIRPPAVRGDV